MNPVRFAIGLPVQFSKARAQLAYKSASGMIRLMVALAFLTAIWASPGLAQGICATPGNDGPRNATAPINTFYPPASADLSVPAGTKSIALGAVPATDVAGNSFGNVAIASGDLLLVIQMQDAQIDSSDTNTYGSGTAGNNGSGQTSMNNSGKYEYAVATSAVPLTGGTLNFRAAGAGGGLINAYNQATPTATRGQRTFQVVRVPQFSSLTLAANVAAPRWNGKTGGIVAFDVAGDFSFGGFSIDASGAGFRAGYLTVNPAGTESSVYRAANSTKLGAGKGEGTAGTPQFMWDEFTAIDNGVQGYPNGDLSRGAPANAGGGGNEHNAGGGGGGNGGRGGEGGYGWEGAGTGPNGATFADTGGRPGFPSSTSAPAVDRLILGGGGGGGDANNATSGVRGGVGGGIVLIRAGRIVGSGTMIANGTDGDRGAQGSAPDGAGGGGAGGTVLVSALSNSPTANLTIQVNGGKGGNTAGDNGVPHGPGGGGGGGVVLTNVSGATITTSVAGGANGKTNDGAGITHNAAPGAAGLANTFTTASDPFSSGFGAACYPQVQTTKSEANAGAAGARVPPVTAVYTISTTNTGTTGAAGGVQIADALPAGFTFASATVAYTGNAAGPTSPLTNQGTASSVLFGDFNIPSGGVVTITLTVNIAATVASGTYNNPAQANYLDPTRSTASRRITPAANASPGSNTTYEGGTSVGQVVSGSNYDGTATGPTAEDVVIVHPDLNIAKSHTPAIFNAGSTGTFNLTVTNKVSATGSTGGRTVTITDVLPAQFAPTSNSFSSNGWTCTASGQTVTCTRSDVLAAGSSYPVLNVPVNVVGATGSAITNTASVATPGEDPSLGTTGDNTANDTVSVASIGVAKRVSSGADRQADGSFNATYEVFVKNYGAVALSNAQVTDDLSLTFASPATFSVTAVGGTGSNASFNGTSNKNLLAAGITLNPGDSRTVTFTVNLKPNGAAGPYNNTANASGTPPSGPAVTDASNNGTNPNPSGDGNPTKAAENTPTPLTTFPVIGTAKAVVGTPIKQANGSFNVNYSVLVKNLGSVTLSNVQATDDLSTTFPAPTTFSVTAVGGAGSNAGFNGTSNKNLLAAGITLNAGESRTVTFTVNIVPNNSFGPFNNSVTATGTPPTGPAVSDVSNNGTDPDPNNNTNPGDPGEDKPTPVNLAANPQIGAAKSASASAAKGDGSYDVTYSVLVKNIGDITLQNVTATDDLSATFSGAAFNVTTVSGSGANASFNGSSDKNLLGSGVSLNPGESRTITLVVNVKLSGTNFGPFNNTVNVSGKPAPTALDPNPTAVSDASNNGTDPDPNNNARANDPGEDAPTPVSFSPNPVIGVAKSASAPALQADGAYLVTYTVLVENLGNTVLNGAQATDNLSNTFPTPTTFSLTSVSGSGANASFNGTTDQNLLAAGVNLSLGGSRTVTFTVRIVPNGAFGPFNNTSTATAASPAGTTVTDVSNNGSNTDPNGNNKPNDPGEDDPTPVNLNPNPVIGTAKTISSGPTRLADGSYDITYSVIVRNYGNVALLNATANDDLTQTFQSPTTFTVKSASGSGVNSSFNGSSNKNLLAAGTSLSVGQSRTLQFTVNVVPNGNFGPFSNTVTALGTPPATVANPNPSPVTDLSNDGTNPNPSGDNTPNQPAENAPTTVSLAPNAVIGTAKSVSAAIRQADGSYNLTYTVLVKNYGNTALNGVQATDDLKSTFPSPTVFTVTGVSGTDSNASFNGSSNKNLLAAGVSLDPDESRTVTFTLNVKPNNSFGPFDNTVLASGTPPPTTANPSPSPVTDLSNDGTNPDPSGDGDPTQSSENTPTRTSLSPNPVIGTAKAVGAAIRQANGSYTLTYTVIVQNYGNIRLENVSATDNLTLTFPSPTSFTVSNVSGSGANAGFNGSSNRNLLVSGIALESGESRTVTYTVNVVPNGAFGPFDNSVLAAGTTPTSTPGGSQTATDTSINGTNPNPSGDGDPTKPAENNPTRVSLTPNPLIGSAKSASAAALQPDGSYTISYNVLIQNYGNVALSNVQGTDDLSATFPAPASFTVTGVSGSSANPNFDGSGDKNLLGSGVTLNPGESRTVSFSVRVVPNGNFGPFNNNVIAKGTPPGAPPVTDVSDNSNSGLNPDPNGDGDPTEPGENNPTVVTLTPRPVIGTAKAASASGVQADGSYNIIYTVLVKNYGNTVLYGAQATDDLGATFPAPATYAVSSVTGTDANASFDGKTNKKLLKDGIALNPGETRTITFTVNLKPGANNLGPFNNTVLASGTPPSTNANPNPVPVTDVSNNGTDPDPSGDGDPTQASENKPTPVNLSPNPVIGTAKAAGPALLQPNGSYNVTYTVVVKNYGNVTLNNAQTSDDLTTTFPAPTTFTVSGVSGADANASFNGSSNKNLLAAGVTLNPGDSRKITFTLNIVPNGRFGPFENTVIATGTAPAVGGNPAQTVSDRSTDGTNPNPSGDGDPTKATENKPTPVSLSPKPVIGTAKAVSSGPTLNPDGTFDVSFVVYVKNYGNTVLNNAIANDDLGLTFPVPSTFTVTSVTGTGANPSFDGKTNKNLLAAGTSLAIGESRRISFTVKVAPNGNYGPYQNSVLAQGTAPASGGNPAQTVSDRSNDDPNFNKTDPTAVPEPDPNGNNDPTELTENAPTPINVNPVPLAQGKLRLTKTVGQPVARVGEPLPYTIEAFNESSVPMPDLRVEDVLPFGLIYRAGSSLVNGQAIEPTVTTQADDRGRQVQKLVWSVPGVLAPGAKARVQFSANVTPLVPEGNLINTATASAFGGQVKSNAASAAVKVDLGVFTNNIVIVGRVYFDANDNNSFESGVDTPLAGARVYLSDGRYAVTDALGRYSIPDVAPGLYAVRLDPLTAPYAPKPVPDDQGQRGTRYVHPGIGGGIDFEDFPLYPSKGAATKARSTTVTRGAVTLVKILQQGGAGYAIQVAITIDKPVSNLTLTDPLPAGATRGPVTLIGPNGALIPVTVQDGKIIVPGTLEPGKYTLSYAIFTGLPPDQVVTDPDINYDEVIR